MVDRKIVKAIIERTWKNPELKEANLAESDLHRANLQGADLQGAKLMQTDLLEADLTGANLVEANLHGADLKLAKLQKANLQRANLQRAVLQEANLTETNLAEADLPRADLTEANLTRANLQGANLQGANLLRANLNGAILQDAKLEPNQARADLQGAILQGANLQGTNLLGVKLSNTNLEQASINDDTQISLPEGWIVEDGIIHKVLDPEPLNQIPENSDQPETDEKKHTPILRAKPEDRVGHPDYIALTSRITTSRNKSTDSAKELLEKLDGFYGWDQDRPPGSNKGKIQLSEADLTAIKQVLNAEIELQNSSAIPRKFGNIFKEILIFLTEKLDQLKDLYRQEIKALNKSKLAGLATIITLLGAAISALNSFLAWF